MHCSLFSLGSCVFFFIVVTFIVAYDFFLFLSNLGVSSLGVAGGTFSAFFGVLILDLVFALVRKACCEFVISGPIHRVLSTAREVAGNSFGIHVSPVRMLKGEGSLSVVVSGFGSVTSSLSDVSALEASFVSGISRSLGAPLSVVRGCTTLVRSSDAASSSEGSCSGSVCSASRGVSGLIAGVLGLGELSGRGVFLSAGDCGLDGRLTSYLLGFSGV